MAVLGNHGFLHEGDLVTVTGMLTTDGSGRAIDPARVHKVSHQEPLLPFIMVNKNMGGSPADTANTSPIANSPGVYNVGLLVQTCGVITYVDAGGDFLYVDDGSGNLDGSGYYGLRILGPADGWPESPYVGNCLTVTGISSSFEVGDDNFASLMRPRSADDVVQHATGSGLLAYGEQGATLQSGAMMPETREPVEASVDYALAQPDGATVSLKGVQISGDLGPMFGVKEASEPLSPEPRLAVESASTIRPLWTVDVTGTITTLSTGQRMIVPTSILLYTDSSGGPVPPLPTTLGVFGAEWPWKTPL